MSVNSATGTTIAIENTIQGGVNDVDTQNLHVFGDLIVDGNFSGNIPVANAAGTVTGAIQYRSAVDTLDADDEFLYDQPTKKLKVDRIETEISMVSTLASNSTTITPNDIIITNGTEINTIGQNKIAITGSGTNAHIHANVTDFEVGTINNKPISMITNNNERIFIDNDGDVVIHGTSSDLTWNATTDKLNAASIETDVVSTNTITSKTSSDLVIRGGNATSDIVFQTGASNAERFKITDAGVSMIVAPVIGDNVFVYPIFSSSNSGGLGTLSTDPNINFNHQTNTLSATVIAASGALSGATLTGSTFIVCSGSGTQGGIKSIAGGIVNGNEQATVSGAYFATDNKKVTNVTIPTPITLRSASYMMVPVSAFLNVDGVTPIKLLSITHISSIIGVGHVINLVFKGTVFAHASVSPGPSYGVVSRNYRNSFALVRPGQSNSQPFTATQGDENSVLNASGSTIINISAVTWSTALTANNSDILVAATLSGNYNDVPTFFIQGYFEIFQSSSVAGTTSILPITAITVNKSP